MKGRKTDSIKEKVKHLIEIIKCTQNRKNQNKNRKTNMQTNVNNILSSPPFAILFIFYEIVYHCCFCRPCYCFSFKLKASLGHRCCYCERSFYNFSFLSTLLPFLIVPWYLNLSRLGNAYNLLLRN